MYASCQLSATDGEASVSVVLRHGFVLEERYRAVGIEGGGAESRIVVGLLVAIIQIGVVFEADSCVGGQRVGAVADICREVSFGIDAYAEVVVVSAVLQQSAAALTEVHPEFCGEVLAGYLVGGIGRCGHITCGQLQSCAFGDGCAVALARDENLDVLVGDGPQCFVVSERDDVARAEDAVGRFGQSHDFRLLDVLDYLQLLGIYGDEFAQRTAEGTGLEEVAAVGEVNLAVHVEEVVDTAGVLVDVVGFRCRCSVAFVAYPFLCDGVLVIALIAVEQLYGLQGAVASVEIVYAESYGRVGLAIDGVTRGSQLHGGAALCEVYG